MKDEKKKELRTHLQPAEADKIVQQRIDASPDITWLNCNTSDMLVKFCVECEAKPALSLAWPA
jgi:hypothetical protein